MAFRPPGVRWNMSVDWATKLVSQRGRGALMAKWTCNQHTDMSRATSTCWASSGLARCSLTEYCHSDSGQHQSCSRRSRTVLPGHCSVKGWSTPSITWMISSFGAHRVNCLRFSLAKATTLSKRLGLPVATQKTVGPHNHADFSGHRNRFSGNGA